VSESSTALRQRVSIVTPLFNEEAGIAELARRLVAVFTAHPGIDWEWIAVDDGSTDATLSNLRAALPTDHRWQILSLSRNFGQQAALRAGLEAAQADAVILMDGDLQDPPEVIPDLIAPWHQGAQVVFAVRRSRAESSGRRFLTAMFHRAFRAVSGRIMPLDSGNFGLCDAEVAHVLRSLPEHDAFLPALRAWAGYRRTSVSYDRASRQSGQGLSLPKLVGFAWEAVTAFSDLPLRLIFILGLVISCASFAYGSILILQRLLQFFGFFKSLEVLGFTTVAVAVFFMGGVQLLCLGILGEYLARVYREVKGRPHYLIASQESSH